MPSFNILRFPVAVTAQTRAEEARAECLRQHQIRCALADIAWYASIAVACLEQQELQKVQTLRRLTRLMISSPKKPIRMNLDRPADTVAISNGRKG
jgi:hypothetical protein